MSTRQSRDAGRAGTRCQGRGVVRNRVETQRRAGKQALASKPQKVLGGNGPQSVLPGLNLEAAQRGPGRPSPGGSGQGAERLWRSPPPRSFLPTTPAGPQHMGQHGGHRGQSEQHLQGTLGTPHPVSQERRGWRSRRRPGGRARALGAPRQISGAPLGWEGSALPVSLPFPPTLGPVHRSWAPGWAPEQPRHQGSRGVTSVCSHAHLLST